MRLGKFGDDPYFVDEQKKRKRTLTTKLMYRELGVDPDGVRKRQRRSIAQVCDQSQKEKRTTLMVCI